MIPSIPLAGLLLFMASPAETIPLDTSGEKLGTFFFEHLALTGDGGFLLNTNQRLYHWDHRGALVNEIGGPGAESNPVQWISAFYFDPNQRIYWICDYLQKKSFFFDEHGKLLGEGFRFDSSGNRSQVFFRQIIPVSDGLFAVDLSDINFWRNPEPKALVEVRFRTIPGEGVLVQTLGPHFAPLRRKLIGLNYNFKLHWVVREKTHHNLFVVDQVSPTIRHFVPNDEGENGELALQSPVISMALPRYQPPPGYWDETSQTQEDFDHWWFSWSRIHGFYALNDDFLVAYEIPDPDNARGSLEALQRVSRDGKNIGSLMVFKDSFLGVDENHAYLFQERKIGETYQYSVRVVPL